MRRHAALIQLQVRAEEYHAWKRVVFAVSPPRHSEIPHTILRLPEEAGYDAVMAIRVELFGIARQRAGVAQVAVQLPAHTSLTAVLQQLALQIPTLGGELIVGGRLHESLAANLDGVQFISDPATAIRDGQSLLILSADAGG